MYVDRLVHHRDTERHRESARETCALDRLLGIRHRASENKLIASVSFHLSG
jgi:hypothetical protein